MLIARKIENQDVIDLLFYLFIIRSIPEHIRSDNSPEFTARAMRKWLARLGVKTLFIDWAASERMVVSSYLMASYGMTYLTGKSSLLLMKVRS